MPIKVKCPNPNCGKTLSFPDTMAGRSLACPACQHPAQIGRFQIRTQLGAGAFGSVYRAFDPQLEREVALKVPRAETLNDPESRARFDRESKATAKMHHPNIVPVHEVGQDGDKSFIVSAFISGRSLADLIGPGGMDPRKAVTLAIQLLDALAYAHKQGVLHRDVKPANAMVTDEGTLFLTDFGLAGWINSDEARLTHTGAVMGTPAYMAPEQATGDTHRIGPAADQYGAAAALYHMLTGQLPFAGSLAQVYRDIIQRPPLPLSKHRRGIDANLEAICMKALAKSPSERHADCQAFAGALRDWLRSQGAGSGVLDIPDPMDLRAPRSGLKSNPPAAKAADGPLPVPDSTLGPKHVSTPRTTKRKKRELPAWTRPAAIGAALFGVTAAVIWLASSVLLPGPEPEKRTAEASRSAAEPSDKTKPSASSAGREKATKVVKADSTPTPSKPAEAPPTSSNESPLNITETGDEQRRFTGHRGWVRSVAFSPSGRLAASGGDDHTVRIWDLASGTELRRCDGHSADVRSVAFSADGRHLLSGSSDKTIRLWDVSDGREVQRIEGHTEDSWDVACFAGDAQRAFIGTGDGTVRLLNLASKEKLVRFDWQKEAIWSVAVSPTGPYALTGSSAKVIRLWNVETGQEIRRFDGHQNWVRSVAFSPNGKRVISCGDDETVRLWDVATGKQDGRFDRHKGWVFSAVFTPDGRRALSGGHDHTIRLFDAANMKELHRFDGHTDAVWSVAVSRDGRFALSGSADGTLRLWRLPPAE